MMSAARTAMLDLHVGPTVVADPEKRGEAIQAIANLLGTLFMKKKFEQFVGQNLLILYSTDDGSITALVKTHPFGLITVTFEECMAVTPFVNPVSCDKLEEFRRKLHKTLQIRVDKVPVIKRGPPFPVYFTTSDERVLEYDFDELIYEADSKYQNIKIFHSLTVGNCLFLDDLQNLAEKDINYTHGLMKHGVMSYCGKEVLILGGGDGALLHELLKENPKFVTMVDIDKMVIDACKQHLRGACGSALDSLTGPNYEVIVDDCVKKLAEYKKNNKTFDIIFNDLTDMPIAETLQGELWDFIRTILTMSLAVLRDDGHYLNHAIGENSKAALATYEKLISEMPMKLMFKSHSAYVPSFMENWVFYDIWKV